FLAWLVESGYTEFAIVGKKHVVRCMEYLQRHNLNIDVRGEAKEYDLVLTCSDLVIPRNVQGKPVVLVQEGMTDPENLPYHMVRAFRFLPRWLASTSVTGLSDGYRKFCVASEGYRSLFIRKGVNPEKIVVTGIPNFDDCRKFLNNNFPLKGYVLVCTSDSRETLKLENRKKLIRFARKVAGTRQLVFKLHPNENVARATREIQKHAPGALIFSSGSAEEMIANCEVLITIYSSTVYVGL